MRIKRVLLLVLGLLVLSAVIAGLWDSLFSSATTQQPDETVPLAERTANPPSVAPPAQPAFCDPQAVAEAGQRLEEYWRELETLATELEAGPTDAAQTDAQAKNLFQRLEADRGYPACLEAAFNNTRAAMTAAGSAAEWAATGSPELVASMLPDVPRLLAAAREAVDAVAACLPDCQPEDLD